jgi:hypothetical protein
LHPRTIYLLQQPGMYPDYSTAALFFVRAALLRVRSVFTSSGHWRPLLKQYLGRIIDAQIRLGREASGAKPEEMAC